MPHASPDYHSQQASQVVDCRTEDSNTFAERRKRLVGDILVAAGFVSYCGPFNAEYRELLRKELVSRKKSHNPSNRTCP